MAGGEQDWLVAANDAGWLRVMSRAQFKAPQAANQEILGGSGERILAKTELQGGFATRDEALAFLCARITRVVVDYNPVRTRILSIAPERGEAGETFYITVIATGVKQGYRFSFGRGVTVRDETWLGRNLTARASAGSPRCRSTRMRASMAATDSSP